MEYYNNVHLWLNTSEKGIQLYNITEKQLVDYKKTQNHKDINLNSKIVMSFHQDRSGVLWIASLNGLYKMQPNPISNY